MMKRIFGYVILTVLLLTTSNQVMGAENLRVNTYVTDRAKMLSTEVVNDLNQELKRLDAATGNQILVITIPSLKGQDLIEVTEDYFKVNRPGQKGKDNGLILLIAKKERKIRIEVGYGLEEVIPDGKAGAIIREDIGPRFKAEDYNSGTIAGVKAIIQSIKPEYQFAGKLQVKPSKSKGIDDWVAYLLVAIAFGSILFAPRKKRRSDGSYDSITYDNGGSDSGGGFDGGGGDFGGGGASGDW